MLHAAAYAGNIELIDFLLKKGSVNLECRVPRVLCLVTK